MKVVGQKKTSSGTVTTTLIETGRKQTSPNAPSQHDNKLMDDLNRLVELFSKPRPLCVWIVDRPDIENAMKHMCSQLGIHEVMPDTIVLPIGLIVRNWWTSAEREGDPKPDLPFLKPECAGIWVEMSDGKHYKLEA